MIPIIQQLNFDLNFLYTVARTVLPRDILEGLMYGKDFDEPDAMDIYEIEQLIEANKNKLPDFITMPKWAQELVDTEFICQICGGNL